MRGIRQTAIVLPPTVAGERKPQGGRPEAVGQISGEHPGLDEGGALAGSAFIVAPSAAPHARTHPVVVGEHMLAGDLLALLALPHAALLEDVVGLQPMAAGLVEQHAAEPVAQHHGHAPGGAGAPPNRTERPLRGCGRQRRHRLLAQQLEATVMRQSVVTCLDDAVTLGHDRDGEHHPGALVRSHEALRTRDPHPLACLAICRRDLTDLRGDTPSRLVGQVQKPWPSRSCPLAPGRLTTRPPLPVGTCGQGSHRPGRAAARTAQIIGQAE